ncbi:MAG: ABC transporter permease [Verrucomicrobia bacterium]|nr:ABC transporter permease [Verrucomicrobiota bacterium]MDA1087768.1 ABC transporter permease [Verrucomicrobiota bacterium]
MSSVVPTISTAGLVLSFVPTAIVIGIMLRWKANARSALYATLRMLAQLMAIGYVLAFIFESDHFGTIGAVLVIMLGVASRIAIRLLEDRGLRSYLTALIAISVGGVPVLVLVTQAVLRVEPWFSPRYIVPLAGMIFAGSMNAVSLAAERYQAETGRGVEVLDARHTAFQASLIPIMNSLFAVGLVSLPGMMTGQILSGISPLIAAKYQIVVMTMLFGASGTAAATYLALRTRDAHLVDTTPG